ncbi:MAG: outer-membrane lipoprotein carrier protein LolA [Muribaculaceae bacterium]|nr:outer-membrane lipoprotein carrier protein LolA [Muribaculaceae bacterium]
MKKFLLLIIALIISVGGINAQNSMAASAVLDKAIGKILNSKGCEADFKINNDGFSGRGKIITTNNKFKVSLPDAIMWFNGKDLYTFNAAISETTVVIPTEEELTEANPLAYVTSAPKLYNVAFSTVKKPDRYVLELTPKKNSGNIKRITLTIKKSDFTLETIVVEPRTGSPIRADISGFKTGISFSAKEFEYPQDKYSKIELIDLR